MVLYGPRFKIMSKKIEFTVPEGYSFPEGIKEGDQFQELVTLQYKGQRNVCVYGINEIPMPGVGKDEDGYPDKNGDGKQNYDMNYRSKLEKKAKEFMGTE